MFVFCHSFLVSLESDKKSCDCPTSEPNYHVVNGRCIFVEKSEKNYEEAKQNCEVVFGGNSRLFEPLRPTDGVWEIGPYGVFLEY